MKSLINSCLLSTSVVISSLAFGAAADTSAPSDPLNLAGDYTCTGNDRHDGKFTGKLSLALDNDASDFSIDNAAYQFTFAATINGVSASYSGVAAAHDDIMSFYFQNDKTDPESLKDWGTGVSNVSREKDNQGRPTTTIHSFYYAPEYKRSAKDGNGPGGNGVETCVKIDAAAAK